MIDTLPGDPARGLADCSSPPGDSGSEQYDGVLNQNRLRKERTVWVVVKKERSVVSGLHILRHIPCLHTVLLDSRHMHNTTNTSAGAGYVHCMNPQHAHKEVRYMAGRTLTRLPRPCNLPICLLLLHPFALLSSEREERARESQKQHSPTG